LKDDSFKVLFANIILIVHKVVYEAYFGKYNIIVHKRL